MTRETRSKTTQTEVGSSKDSILSKTSSAARVAKTATSQATQKAPPATKRKRTTSAITTTAAVREEGSTAKKAKPTVPSAYTPTLLPPTLSFSLGDAKYHLSRHDPRFGHMFDNIPCKPYAPPIEAIDPFKTLVTSIIGQQVSWMAARAINKRFKELFGFTDDADGFPSPEQVASEDPLRLKSVGLSMRKTEYVISLSQHFIAGSLSTDLLRDGSDEDIAKGLIAVRGIGQWTVDMFLMFSLRRPDVLPVGDLGVQKGLLRWALAAHGVLPTPSKAKGKASEANRKKYGIGKKEEIAELDTTAISTTRAVTPTPSSQVNGAPPTPLTPGAAPHTATLHTPQDNINPGNIGLPPITPNSPTTRPAEHLVVPKDELPTSIPEPEVLLRPMTEHKDWNPHAAAPLEEGLSVDVLKARLSGKKAKGGAYLTPKEMEVLTDGWRPYRSLGVYYMWPAGEDF